MLIDVETHLAEVTADLNQIVTILTKEKKDEDKSIADTMAAVH